MSMRTIKQSTDEAGVLTVVYDATHEMGGSDPATGTVTMRVHPDGRTSFSMSLPEIQFDEKTPPLTALAAFDDYVARISAAISERGEPRVIPVF